MLTSMSIRLSVVGMRLRLRMTTNVRPIPRTGMGLCGPRAAQSSLDGRYLLPILVRTLEVLTSGANLH